MSPEKAFQISLGNIDINTGKVIADFNPDNFKVSTIDSPFHFKKVSLFCFAQN